MAKFSRISSEMAFGADTTIILNTSRALYEARIKSYSYFPFSVYSEAKFPNFLPLTQDTWLSASFWGPTHTATTTTTTTAAVSNGQPREVDAGYMVVGVDLGAHTHCYTTTTTATTPLSMGILSSGLSVVVNNILPLEVDAGHTVVGVDLGVHTHCYIHGLPVHGPAGRSSGGRNPIVGRPLQLVDLGTIKSAYSKFCRGE